VSRDCFLTFLATQHARESIAGPAGNQLSSILDRIAEGAHHPLLSHRFDRGLHVIRNHIDRPGEGLVYGLEHAGVP